MNLLERYALQCGLKPSEPYIFEKFFPMPFDKYILIHSGGGQVAKQYDFYEEVISLIYPALEKNGYKIVQIGGPKDPKLNGIADLRGASNLGQTAYLLKNAALLIGNDSCNAHIASHFKTPHVVLFGSTCPKNHAPAFGGKGLYIESHRHGNKPSFMMEENPKTINLIRPEEVAKAALKALDIREEITRETLFIGDRYTIRFLEVVMDTIIDPRAFPGAVPVIRMDYLFDENILANNLQHRQFGIITNKAINLNLLKNFRNNIAGIIYLIEEDYSVDFVKNLMENGISYQLKTYITEKKLGKLKLEFFDYGIIEAAEETRKENLENAEKMTNSTLCKTNKFLLSKDKIFLSKQLWKENKAAESFEKNSFIPNLDDPEFLKEVQHYYIYNE